MSSFKSPSHKKTHISQIRVSEEQQLLLHHLKWQWREINTLQHILQENTTYIQSENPATVTLHLLFLCHSEALLQSSNLWSIHYATHKRKQAHMRTPTAKRDALALSLSLMRMSFPTPSPQMILPSLPSPRIGCFMHETWLHTEADVIVSFS